MTSDSGSRPKGRDVQQARGEARQSGGATSAASPNLQPTKKGDTVEHAREDFVPCPFCKQYSHSISDDRLAAAFNHFQSMYAHPIRGHAMGDNFDEQTRDAAQVLMAAARSSPEVVTKLVEALRQARQVLSVYQPDSAPTFYMEAIWNADAALSKLSPLVQGGQHG